MLGARVVSRLGCLLLGALLAGGCKRSPSEPEAPRAASSGSAKGAVTALPAAAYVGSERCKDCHTQAYAAWSQSQHRKAIQVPSVETVLGDFQDRAFTFQGERTRFSNTAGGYQVEALGVWHAAGSAEVALRSFDVKYTFGVTPLQQYLLDSGDGHLQAFTVAYDTRPPANGGGRWYQLQPEQRAKPGDELHWTAAAYNWNSSCADCHSTALEKGYDAAKARYDTRFSELSVGCEACHGPASRHVTQATAGKLEPDRGLTRDFARSAERLWALQPGQHIATLGAGSASPSEVEACAFCHSQRGDLGGSSLQFHDRYRLDWLDQQHYHPDGQQRQETFEVGSFMQSKMFAAGVVCSDCHEPHAGALRRPGNALCSGCHDQARYDAPSHHLHVPDSTAAQCVQCHMPTHTFMGLDARREHRLSVPRPDLSVTLGVPNPCTDGCHVEKRRAAPPRAAATWAAGVIRERFGAERPPSFGPSLDAGHALAAGGQAALLDVVKSPNFPAIARASALAELRAYPELPWGLVEGQGRDGEPVVRRAFAELAAERPPEQRTRALVPLLSDRHRSVRLEAGRGLLDVQRASLSPSDQAKLTAVLLDLRASLEHNADRPGALLELARLELATAADAAQAGVRAETLFRRAIALEATFAATYLNYADFLRQRQREPEALKILQEGLGKCRDRAPLEHALGLAWVRRGDKAKALEHLASAHRLAPDSGQLAYVYAVALFDAGKQAEAITLLEQVQQRSPGDLGALELLARYVRLSGALERATELDERLQRARSATR